MWMFWAIVAIQAVFSGILASILADRKGHSEGAWFVAGLFLGVFGLIAAAGLPDMYARQGQHTPASGASRTCPDCAEPIRAEARVCKYCGHAFSDEDLITDAVQFLNSDDEDARLNAIRVLCDIGGHSVISHLIDVLGDCPPEVSANVASKLKSLGASSAVPALQDTLISAFSEVADTSSKADLVASCCDALAELADAAIGADLVQILDLDASLDSRVRVIGLLGSLRATEQIPELLEIADSNRILRTHAFEAIRNMGRDSVPVLQRALGMAGRRQKRMIQGLLDELGGGSEADSRESK